MTTTNYVRDRVTSVSTGHGVMNVQLRGGQPALQHVKSIL